MNYHIGVCDDSDTYANYIESLARHWAQSKNAAAVVDTFPSAEAFLFHYEEDKTYDILLLDIEMGKTNGVELAKEIRRGNDWVQIIFITGYSDYIAEGYEVSALHYLMKPVDKLKLFAVLDRAAEKLKKNERRLLLEVSGDMMRIPIHEIRYIEVNQNYVTIHGKEDYTVKRTLKELEKELDENFFRTGRSFIINLSYIRKVTKKEVWLSDGSSIPLPRGMYEPLNRAIISRT